MVVSYVNQNSIKEDVLDLAHLRELNAVYLKDWLCDVLLENGIVLAQCVAQTYNGASVMSGGNKGIQALFRAEHAPKENIFIFITRLNLVIVETVKSIKQADPFFPSVLPNATKKSAISHWSVQSWNIQVEWDPWTKTSIEKMEVVQRTSARIVPSNFSKYARVTQMLQELKWTSLRERRAKATAIIMYRIVNNLIAIPMSLLQGPTLNRGWGHDQKRIVPHSRTQNHQYSFIPDATRIWNKLPQTLVESKSREVFRKGTDELI